MGYPCYLEDGRFIVDRVVNYDRPSSDFNEFLATWACLASSFLMHVKPTKASTRAAHRAFVYEQCVPEFELFGVRADRRVVGA